MRKTLVLVLALIVAAFCLPSNTQADPTIVNDLVFSDNRPADDIFGAFGLRVQLDLAATDTGGSGALSGAGAGTKATSSNPSFPFSQPVTVPVNSFFGLLGVEFTSNLLLSGGAADFSKVAGTYGFTVTNTSAQNGSATSRPRSSLSPPGGERPTTPPLRFSLSLIPVPPRG